MLRYRLRTLLILLALLPPLLWIGWGKYAAWRAERERERQIEMARRWVQEHQTSPPWFIPADPQPPNTSLIPPGSSSAPPK